MKKLISLIALLIFVFCLFSCSASPYNSRYSATLQLKNEYDGGASHSFNTFKGTMVLSIKNRTDKDCKLRYNGSLDSGIVDVSYDIYTGEKNLRELFSVTSGVTKSQTGDFIIENDYIIYIIIDAQDVAKGGEFTFELVTI